MRGAPLIFDDPELWGPNQQKKKKPPSNLIATECASLLREREREKCWCADPADIAPYTYSN